MYLRSILCPLPTGHCVINVSYIHSCTLVNELHIACLNLFYARDSKEN